MRVRNRHHHQVARDMRHRAPESIDCSHTLDLRCRSEISNAVQAAEVAVEKRSFAISHRSQLERIPVKRITGRRGHDERIQEL